MKHQACLFLSLCLSALAGASLAVPTNARGETAASECACCAGACGCSKCTCDQCRPVQEVHTEKKWVYAVKLVPYCKTKCPNPFRCRHTACETCPACERCVRYKRVLVKRAVESQKTVCKCVPACEACRARITTESVSNVAAADAIAQPGEPQPVPPLAR